MSSRILILAAALAAIATAGAASAASPDTNVGEVCTVDGVAVDPRFCVDYVGPARWVDPGSTGGVEDRVVAPGAGEHIVAPNAGGHVMTWKPTGHADGLLVEVITP